MYQKHSSWDIRSSHIYILTSDDTTPGTAASNAKAVEVKIWSFMMMMIEFVWSWWMWWWSSARIYESKLLILRAQRLQNNILPAEWARQEGFLLCFWQQNVDTRHHVSHLIKIFFLVFALYIIPMWDVQVKSWQHVANFQEMCSLMLNAWCIESTPRKDTLVYEISRRI